MSTRLPRPASPAHRASSNAPPRRSRLHGVRIATALAVGIAVPLTQFTAGGAASDNLLSANQNSFESGTAGVVAVDGESITAVTKVKYAGERSLRIVSRKRSGTRTAAATTTPGRDGVAVAAGASYAGSAQMRSSVSARSARCQLNWYGPDGSFHSRTDGTSVTATNSAWTKASCAGTAPAGATYLALAFEFSGVSPLEQSYVDDAWLTGGPTTTTTLPPVTSPPPAIEFAARVSSGGWADTSVDGNVFVVDRDYIGGDVAGPMNHEIADTTGDDLYRKHRWGMTGYTVPVPAPGVYTVRLHFAEVVFQSAGYRVFDVSAEGGLVLDNLDVAARVGPNRALVEEFTVAVDDALDLRFGAVVEDPMVSGVEVLSTGTTTAPPATTTTTAPPTAPTTTAPPATTTTTAPPAATTTTTSPPAAPTTTTTTAPPAPTTPTNPSTAYPDATNTGVPAGTVLRPSGTIYTTAPGQVIDAMDVNGSIRVVHDNVVIRRTRVRNPGGEAIWLEPGRGGLLVEDCELDGTGNPNGAAAIAFSNFTVRRCNIHHFGEGITASGNTVIEDNYLHSFVSYVAQGAHQDGIQMEWGSNQLIRHNTILMNVNGANSAIWVSWQQHSNIRIENNLVAGANFTIGAGGGGPNGNFDTHVTNNRISTRYYPQGGYWGPFTYYDGAVLSGNVWHETGLPVG